MPHKCSVPGCKSNYYAKAHKYVSVFSFPKEPHRRQEWIRAINRDHFEPGNSAVVCINHFSEQHIVREDRIMTDSGSVLVMPRKIPKLSKDACPSIFPNKPPPKRKQREKRKQELMSRDEETDDFHSVNKLKKMETVGSKLSEYDALSVKSEDHDIHIKVEKDEEESAIINSVTWEDQMALMEMDFTKDCKNEPFCSDSEESKVHIKIEVDEESMLIPFQRIETEFNMPLTPAEKQHRYQERRRLAGLHEADKARKRDAMRNFRARLNPAAKRERRKKDAERKKRERKMSSKLLPLKTCDLRTTNKDVLPTCLAEWASVCAEAYNCANKHDTKSATGVSASNGLHYNEEDDRSTTEERSKNKSKLSAHEEKNVSDVNKSGHTYTCDICQKSLSTLQNLLIHSRTHTGDRPYSCKICKKTFSYLVTMKRHLQTHTSNCTYFCDKCHKSFEQVSTLQIHTQKHTGDRPYSCEICRKTFNCMSDLRVHIRIHTGERPYTCDICKNSFKNWTNLKSHYTRIHSSERPYSCEICKKSFTQLKHLSVHKLNRTGERTHTCNICKQSFCHLKGLVLHYQIHSNARPYSCETCDKSFTRSYDFKVHLQDHCDKRSALCEDCKK